MQVVSDISEIQSQCQKWRDKGESISFVPTMGCLHAGHLSLVKKAQEIADHVVVSIFVNPLQFDNAEDLLKYPNTLADDKAKLDDFDVGIVFVPDVSSLYPEGENNVEQIDLGDITAILEGAQRPGHFAGVATVVKRLFDLVQPNSAIFGEKDFQQVMLIQQLVKKFKLDIKILAEPTLREENGLAMSSRNVRLSEAERAQASEIYRQLEKIKAALNSGKTNYEMLEEAALENLKVAGFTPEYVVIRDVGTLQPPQDHTKGMVILVAAKLGEIRLIDNMRV